MENILSVSTEKGVGGGVDFVEDIKTFKLFVDDGNLERAEVLFVGEVGKGGSAVEEEFGNMSSSFGDGEVEGSVRSFVFFGW